MTKPSKQDIFAKVPVGRALLTMAIPTIISQLINLIYNMVDAFFIGRTGNSYMMAATTVAMTLAMLSAAVANLFGIGGGSLFARLLGKNDHDNARKVSAFSIYSGAAAAAVYAVVLLVFLNPLLMLLGASSATLDFARTYTSLAVVACAVPSVLAMVLSHLLRNAGFATQSSLGLSVGGIVNVLLDPLFMFVILPPGQEVTGAALATLISNIVSFLILLVLYVRARREMPLSLSIKQALSTKAKEIKELLSVGVPSAILTGLFDLANICINKLSSNHNDLVLAGMGIVMKVERIPNSIDFGICQGMLPLVAYNFSFGDRERMNKVISLARNVGLIVAGIGILLYEIFANDVCRVFLSTTAGDPETAKITLDYAVLFLRIRCLAAPLQFINYHTSYSMQAMGNGRATMLHAFVRELVFYIPSMFVLDAIFGELGIAAAAPVGEGLGAVFALFLLHRILKKHK